MNQLTKITLAWELFEQAVPKAHIANQLGVTRETVHVWIKGMHEKQAIYYISGPEPMVMSYEKILSQMGIKKSHLKTDYFPGYKDI